MRIPISETELGGWYEFFDCAEFRPVSSSYYDNYMIRGNYKVTTFQEFKQTYPIQIANGLYGKKEKYENR